MINKNWTNTNNISKGINALVNSGLEQQINELRLAQIELEKSRNYFSALYQFSPVSHLTLNDDGIIVDCNNAVGNLLGINLEQLRLRRFERLIAEQHKECWNRFWLLSKQSADVQICELSLIRADLSDVYVKLKCIRKQLLRDTAPVVLVTLTDITIYKRFSQEISTMAVAFETQ
jgi:PAS domain S-box-containing protein